MVRGHLTAQAISQTGSKGHQHRKSLPPCQRSPVPEPCFYAGARHQSEVGLSLPNRIRDQIFQILETRDKFLAPMTVPQARSTAFIELTKT
jgi:hypothetical protein